MALTYRSLEEVSYVVDTWARFKGSQSMSVLETSDTMFQRASSFDESQFACAPVSFGRASYGAHDIQEEDPRSRPLERGV